MANAKSKSESIKRTKKDTSIKKSKKSGGEKKLSDLPKYKTAEKRKPKKKTGGLMASVNRRMKK